MARTDPDELTGLADAMKRSQFHRCEFEQLANNRVVIHLPDHLRLSDVERMLSRLSDHIDVTHIGPTTLHMQTDHPTFTESGEGR